MKEDGLKEDSESVSMLFPTLLLCSWVFRHAVAAVFAQETKILKDTKYKINNPEIETLRQDLCLLVSKSLFGCLDALLFRLGAKHVCLLS